MKMDKTLESMSKTTGDKNMGTRTESKDVPKTMSNETLGSAPKEGSMGSKGTYCGTRK